MVWGHEILLLVGVVCVVVSLDCWSIVVAARDNMAIGSMDAVLLTHAILLLSCSWGGTASWANKNKQSYDQTQVSHYSYSFLLHNIITTLLVTMMIWINTAPLLLLHFRFQQGMFNGATSFNQNVSSWDTSVATSFVSGLGPCDLASCWCRLRRRVFRLLEGALSLLLVISWLLAA